MNMNSASQSDDISVQAAKKAADKILALAPTGVLLPRGYVVVRLMLDLTMTGCYVWECECPVKFNAKKRTAMWLGLNGEFVHSVGWSKWKSFLGTVELQGGAFDGYSLILNEIDISGYIGVVPDLSKKQASIFLSDVAAGLMAEIAAFVKQRKVKAGAAKNKNTI